MVQPIWPSPALGVRRTSVSTTPAAASRQPATIGMRGPTAATHRPVKTAATTMAAAMGRKSTAVRYDEFVPTTWR